MIFDAFLYNGEKELLEIRLNETCLLGDWVTTVLVEANKTHTGNDKELHFEKHKTDFSRFNIMYFVVEDMPENATAKEREIYQRNKISEALNFLSPKDDDTVIISDVDEIPRTAQLNKFHGIDFAALIMDKYAYGLNILESEQSWDRARAMSYRYLRNKTPNEVRDSGYDFSLHHAGWHYSWICDPLNKLQSFSHTEFDNQENIEKIENKENFWNDDELTKIEINLSHPEYLYKNQDKFKHLIL